jgi:hypothetical protein
MREKNIKLFNLLQFDNTCVRPAAFKFARAGSKHVRTFYFSELVAYFFWLGYGIDIDYFPREEASSLVGQRYGEVFADFDDTFTYYGYIFDPEFRILLQTAQSLQDPFAQFLPSVTVPANDFTYASFRAAMIAEIALVRNESAETLLAVVNFEPSMLSEVLDLNRAIERPGETVFDQGVVIRGCAPVLSYMGALVDLSRRMRSEPGALIAERISMDRRIRQLTRWRMNRFRMGSDDDFMAAVAFASADAEINWDSVESAVRELLNDWGYTHSKQMTA